MIKRATKDPAAVPMTTARARLFQLVEDVLTGRAPRVALSHRGYDEHVVLMRAGDVARLEADLVALRARVGPELRPLRGLGRLRAPAEDVVADVRARQNARSETKRRELLEAAPDARAPADESEPPAVPVRPPRRKRGTG